MKPIYTYILIIALIVGAAFFADEYLASTTFGESSTSQGMTIESISSNVNVVGRDDISKINYRVSAVLNTAGESVEARIDNSDLSIDGTNVKNDFKIDVDSQKEYATYSIENTGQNIYKYTLTIKEPGACSVAADFRIPLGYERGFPYYDWLQVKEICVYKIKDATIGDVRLSTIEGSAIMSVSSTKDNKVYTKELNTVSDQSINFKDSSGNKLVDVRWTGSKVTGNQPPQADRIVATYISPIAKWSITNIWTLSPRNELTNYNKIESNVDSQLLYYKNHPRDANCDSIESCTTIVQSQLDLVNDARKTLIGGTTPTIGSAQTFVDRDNLNAGKIRINFDRKFLYPTIIMDINADWLGISMPVGQPKILSVNCPTFASGDTSGLCEIKVKNIGDSTGTFVLSMSNSGIFTQQYVPSHEILRPGETKIMRIHIDHGLHTQETSKIATFTVYDYKNPDKRDSMTATISMTEPKLCVPGTIRPSGLNVYECRADGSGEDLILSCPSGTTLIKDVNDEWSCSEPLNGEPPTEEPSFLAELLDKIMKELFGEEFGVDDIIPAIIMILIGIIGIYLLILLIPIILPMLGKALLGLILRK